MEEESKREHQDLIDTSNLHIKRGQRQLERSKERIERVHHEWHFFRLGRICLNCTIIQLRDELDDSLPCEPEKTG